ncbi:MAG: hypothetical protein IT305_12805 [Chloroflexi bacterium]|nr:hypothetical protein [Chloroflexota bacterium]
MGDLLEIETRRGLAYAQCTVKDKVYGQLIRVLPGLFSERPIDLEILVTKPERYVAFFPAGAALSQGLVSFVGTYEVPSHARTMPLMRARGAPTHDGGWDWWLTDGEKEWRVGRLLPEQTELSLSEIWMHGLLVERIASGWKPSDDV